MTDHIPADKVEKIAAEMRDAMRREEDGYLYADFLSDMSDYIRDLESLLPAPPRPTLADMTDDERAACRWMQADIKPWGRAVIIDPDRSSGRAALIDREDGLTYWDYYRVTPRPDLPRMTWPGTEKPAPALPDGWRLADHRKYGRVIVTNTTPGIDGNVYFVSPAALPMGYDCHFCDPAELTYIDQEGDQ